MPSTPTAVVSVFDKKLQIIAGKVGLDVKSDNPELRRIALQAASFAAERYTPSMGGPMAFVANLVAEQMDGMVVSVNEGPTRKGRVY
jgi:hypothetical protein